MKNIMAINLISAINLILLILFTSSVHASMSFEELELTTYSKRGGEWWELNYGVNDVKMSVDGSAPFFIDGNEQAILLTHLINSGDYGQAPDLKLQLDNLEKLNLKAKLFAFRDISIVIIVLVVGVLWLKRKKTIV